MEIERLANIMKEGFDAVDARFDAVDARLESIEDRLTNLERDVRDLKRDVLNFQDRLEGVAGYAKEIDELMTRIVAIEKHLEMKST